MSDLTFRAESINDWKGLVRAGDRISLSGKIYTARDAAHKRIFAALESGDPLPFELKGAMIYYAGPTPAKNGLAVGSCGPTTSSRMDRYTPRLMELGVAATIGKGPRNEEVREAIVRCGGLYLCAVGGAGALLSKAIKSSEVVAYDDLGTEAIRKLRVENFPVIVVMDSQGNNLYETAIKEYCKD